MKTVELTFKYEIGDIVIQKVVMDSMLKERQMVDSKRFPEGMRVIMRNSEECVAGTQLSYICEPWQGGTLKYAENSLAPIGEAYDAIFELYTKKLKEKAADTQLH